GTDERLFRVTGHGGRLARGVADQCDGSRLHVVEVDAGKRARRVRRRLLARHQVVVVAGERDEVAVRADDRQEAVTRAVGRALEADAGGARGRQEVGGGEVVDQRGSVRLPVELEHVLVDVRVHLAGDQVRDVAGEDGEAAVGTERGRITAAGRHLQGER